MPKSLKILINWKNYQYLQNADQINNTEICKKVIKELPFITDLRLWNKF